MQNVPVMDCLDGISRADDACWGDIPQAKTASYTLLQGDVGTIFTNRGAAGAITFTLPAPKAGMWFTFWKAVQNQNMLVTTDVAGTKIHGGSGATQGVTLTNSTATEYGSVTVVCDGTAWFTQGVLGTWAVS